MATKRTSALFLGLALAAMGTSASAGSSGGGGYDYDYDWKSLPGATCHAKNGYDAKYFKRDMKEGSIYYDDDGYGGYGGGGYDDDYKEVICPVLRDGYNRGNYKDSIKAYFWVKSNYYGEELKCTLYSSSPTKEYDYWSDWDSTTSDSKHKLNFEIHNSMKYGSYYFHCRVPKGGHLYYYFYKEAGPTDYDG